jgi:hypothetical protein
VLQLSPSLRTHIEHLCSREDDVLASPFLAREAWRALTNLLTELDGGRVLSVEHPPWPFSGCSWPSFIPVLPFPAAVELLAQVSEASVDCSACIALLSIRSIRRITKAVALWPIRDTIRDLLVPAYQRTEVRQMQSMLSKRIGEDFIEV